MLRVKYSHQQATAMFAQGQTPTDVARMLVEEGATEAEAPALARQYYRNFLLYRVEQERKAGEQAGMHKLIGGVLLGAGLAMSFLMYLMMDDGNYVLFYGAILVGAFYLLKGFTAQSRTATTVEALLEKHRLAHESAAEAP